MITEKNIKIQERIRGGNKIHKYTKKKTYSEKKRLRKNNRPVFKKRLQFLVGLSKIDYLVTFTEKNKATAGRFA